MVFYRKYRPQTINDLDSAQVREKLYAVLKDPSTSPHAFLFTGPKGLGKTSTARIIAKVLNCTASKKERGESGIEPCNSCSQCQAITNGTAMDILEIDAASNRGIDEIRELKEKIKLAPLNAKKKVYIIDEVHMLTTEAFNALLKTLEEPPEHAVFMLCTTEPQKVPATIHSRTFHMTFQKASREELIRSFQRIVKAEKIAITDDALEKIASLSDGGFRDGTKMLEEVYALAGGKEITPELIEEKYRITGFSQRTEEFLMLLKEKRTKEALLLIGALVNEGNDIRSFLEQCIALLHAVLLRNAGVATSVQSGTVDFSFSELRMLLPLLTQAFSDMKYAVVPQLPLEIAVIEWTTSVGTEKIAMESGASADRHSDVKSDGGIGVERTVVVTGNTQSVSVTTLRKQAGNIKKVTALYGEQEDKKPKKDPGPPANVSVLDFRAEGEITPEWLQEFWRCMIQDIKKHNHTLAGVLRGCMIKSFDRKVLVIETSYAFHRDKLDNAKTKEILEEICRELTGNTVAITVELKSA